MVAASEDKRKENAKKYPNLLGVIHGFPFYLVTIGGSFVTEKRAV